MPQIVQTLQTATGLLLGTGALMVGAVFYVRMTEVQGVPAHQAWRDGYFLGMGATGVLALVSAFVHTPVGRRAQLAIFFFTAMAAGITAIPGDLTPLALFGLFLAYSLVYLDGTRRARRGIAIGSVVFLGGWVGGVGLTAGENLPGLVVTFLAGGIVAALLAMLVHAVHTIQASQNEILEARIAEGTKELEDALAETRGLLKHNRVLLREVHHRTKNNLQVVASLLSLRQQTDEDTDRGSQKVIDIARNHVYSMAMIHELFHTSSRSASVYFTDFLTEIAELWKRNSLVSEVTIELGDIEKMAVSMDFAIPVGLALNELVANISEHGYPNTREKPIRIHASRSGEEIGLSISDDGIGFPEHVSLERPTTTGLQIIASLVQQLHGKIDVVVDEGTTFCLTLPCAHAVSGDEGCE